ncbi:hypothetical protein TNCV_2818951 [Trichonephila clavipes]|nr:hypothetical protein TNCV_2818951 [Trichonephila clavipes]
MEVGLFGPQNIPVQKFVDYPDHLVRAAALATVYRDHSVRPLEESYKPGNEVGQLMFDCARNAKIVDLKWLIESDVFKEDYELVKTVIEQVLEEIKTQKSKQNSQIELERLKLERVKVELKLAKLRNSVNNCEISLNGCETEMSIVKDMELPQGTEEVHPVKSE